MNPSRYFDSHDNFIKYSNHNSPKYHLRDKSPFSNNSRKVNESHQRKHSNHLKVYQNQ